VHSVLKNNVLCQSQTISSPYHTADYSRRLASFNGQCGVNCYTRHSEESSVKLNRNGPPTPDSAVIVRLRCTYVFIRTYSTVFRTFIIPPAGQTSRHSVLTLSVRPCVRASVCPWL